MAKGWYENPNGPKVRGSSHKIISIKKQITSPDIFPSQEEMNGMSCDAVILWAIESFDIAHLVKEHDYNYQGMNKDDFADKFADSIFDMHEILGLKCGCGK